MALLLSITSSTLFLQYFYLQRTVKFIFAEFFIFFLCPLNNVILKLQSVVNDKISMTGGLKGNGFSVK